MCFVVSSLIFCIAEILLFSKAISLISSVIIDLWIFSNCSVYTELTLVLYVDINVSTSSITDLLLSICFFVNVSKLLIYLSILDKSGGLLIDIECGAGLLFVDRFGRLPDWLFNIEFDWLFNIEFDWLLECLYFCSLVVLLFIFVNNDLLLDIEYFVFDLIFDLIDDLLELLSIKLSIWEIILVANSVVLILSILLFSLFNKLEFMVGVNSFIVLTLL